MMRKPDSVRQQHVLKGHSLYKKSLAKQDVEQRMSHTHQTFANSIILFCCLCDVLGTVLLMPFGTVLCQLANGGPMQQLAKTLNTSAVDLTIQQAASKQQLWQANTLNISLPYEQAWVVITSPDGGIVSRYAFVEVASMPTFSFATNLCNVVIMAMMALGHYVLVPLSDHFGPKLIIQVSVVGNTLSLFSIFLIVTLANSFWLFMSMLSCKGFFSVNIVIAQRFFTNLYGENNAKQAQPWITAALSMSALGGVIGSASLLPFTSPPPGDNCVYAFLVAVAASAFSLVLLTVFVSEQRQKESVTQPFDVDSLHSKGASAEKFRRRVNLLARAASGVSLVADACCGLIARRIAHTTRMSLTLAVLLQRSNRRTSSAIRKCDQPQRQKQTNAVLASPAVDVERMHPCFSIGCSSRPMRSSIMCSTSWASMRPVSLERSFVVL